MSKFKGFAGAPQTKMDAATQKAYFSCGIVALHNANFTEAYLSFSALPDCPAALFNLALCYCGAGLYEPALVALQQAQKALAAMAASAAPRGTVPAKMTQQDAQSDAYRAPMARQLVALFPTLAKLRVLRLMADIYGDLGYEQEFLRILPLFAGKDYQNIAKIKLKFEVKKE